MKVFLNFYLLKESPSNFRQGPSESFFSLDFILWLQPIFRQKSDATVKPYEAGAGFKHIQWRKIVYYPTMLQAAWYCSYISTFGKCPQSATITFTPIVVVIIRIFHLNWIIVFQVISDCSSKLDEMKNKCSKISFKTVNQSTFHSLPSVYMYIPTTLGM